jgi:hypothetical protein
MTIKLLLNSNTAADIPSRYRLVDQAPIQGRVGAEQTHSVCSRHTPILMDESVGGYDAGHEVLR